MPDPVRQSGASLKVLSFLLSDVGKQRSGAEITLATNVSSGTLYPMLARLEKAGWLLSNWETSDPIELGRPRRRFYRLSALGQSSARSALADLQIGGALSWQH